MIEMKKKDIKQKMIGPKLTADDVAEMLGESSTWVLALARRDPEKHPDGRYLEGWVRKPGRVPGLGPDKWQTSDFVSSRDPAIRDMKLMGIAARVYFYKETIDAYLARFPRPSQDESENEKEPIDEKLIQRVRAIAEPELKELGHVTRARVKAELNIKYPGEYVWRTDIGAVCDGLGYPMKNHRTSSKKRVQALRREKKQNSILS